MVDQASVARDAAPLPLVQQQPEGPPPQGERVRVRGRRRWEKWLFLVPALAFQLVWGWYQRWADAGLWPNRFAVMSDAELLDFESMSASARLRAPYLMFHSDQCMLPDAARRHFDRVPGEKRMEWWGDTLHFQFYDDPAVIDRAAAGIADWFRAHAGPPPA